MKRHQKMQLFISKTRTHPTSPAVTPRNGKRKKNTQKQKTKDRKREEKGSHAFEKHGDESMMTRPQRVELRRGWDWGKIFSEQDKEVEVILVHSRREKGTE